MSEDKKIFLSVVIPSYNETENLKRGVLKDVADYLSSQKYTWEVVVSDDGSPDELGRTLAKDFCEKTAGFKFLENEHAGKPFAVWSGIQATKGEIILFADMDQSTPIKEVGKLLPYFDQGYDIVIGSRGIERKNSSLFRRLGSWGFRQIRKTVLLSDIVDTQAGFKSFKAAVAKDIFPRMQILKTPRDKTTGWKVTSFDVELLYIAEKHGYKIAEVTVDWENRDFSMDVKKSSNKGKFINESIRMFQELWRVKYNDLTGYYDK